MNQRIIYPNDEGGLAVIIPAHSLDEALNAIPAGKPYKVVKVEDFPLDGTFNEEGLPNADRTFRDAWMDDFSNPDGYGK